MVTNDNDIISGFEGAAPDYAASSYAVDFSLAKRLERSGATCDAYECTLQRRRVFVKRLKAQYRANPLYRAAFDKEYDLGVGLNHPSLPRYVGFGGDYIVMDFIEGDTLALLIKRGDSRLKNRKFVRRILLELLDVVEYLHRRNIVHCDIKPDNVIISPYAERPVTLIDLDKAYTSWLSSTADNPEKYQCTGCADGAVDIHGVGLIAAKLGCDKFSKLCEGADVTIGQHRTALLPRCKTWWTILSAVAIALVGVGAYMMYEKGASQAVVTELPAVADSAISVPPPTTLTEVPSREDTSRKALVPLPPKVDNAWIDRLIREKADSIEPLQKQMLEIIADTALTPADVTDSYYAYQEKYRSVFGSIIYTAVCHHPRQIELDVQLAVRNHPLYRNMEETDLEITRQSFAGR